MSLEQNRKNLFTITQNLLISLRERSQLVNTVQKIKKQKSLRVWDPRQEAYLFNSLKIELEKSSLKELLNFSLIIEMHSSQNSDYPEWIERVHIDAPKGIIAEQINPILLGMFYPDEYAKLTLKDTYKNEVGACLNNHE